MRIKIVAGSLRFRDPGILIPDLDPVEHSGHDHILGQLQIAAQVRGQEDAPLFIDTAFGDSADFSGIKKDEKVKIDKVIHKSFVEVNEEGTEAAAATSVGIAATSLPVEPQTLKFDRPFAYLIREAKTGQVLFLGLMRNPASSK